MEQCGDHYRSERGNNYANSKVDGVGEFEVPQGKRLVLALVQDAGIDQLHACGGNARCTTCRVEFLSGEPEQMTVAEKNVLAAKGVSGVRLSCQIMCDHDMTVRGSAVWKAVVARIWDTNRPRNFSRLRNGPPSKPRSARWQWPAC